MKHFLLVLILALLTPAVTLGDTHRDLLKLAHAGDAVAMRRIGIRKFKGAPGTPIDRKNAVAWLKKAAEKNDTEAMYFLGMLYMNGTYVGQDSSKGAALLKGAAERGHEKSKKKLASLNIEDKPKVEVVNEPPPAPTKPAPAASTPPSPVNVAAKPAAQSPAKKEPELPSISVKKLLPGIVQDIAGRANTQGVQSVAVVPFLTNGKKTNELTATLRDELLEALLDAPNITISDRKDSKLVVAEAGLSFEGSDPLEAASAILAAEVFCQPGDEYGYFAYRVFSASDTRIIAAGFERVKWTAEEQKQLNGSVSKKAAAPLSFITDEELNNGISKLKTRLKETARVAMVQDGGNNADNTVDSRMAYSQVVAAMLKSGIKLFEREFMREAAEEASIKGAVVDGGNGINAVGYVRHTMGDGNENKLKVQVSSVQGGALLATANIAQKKGSALGANTGNNSENNFADFLADLEKDAKDVKLVYEYEVYITNDYTIPQEVTSDSTYIYIDENKSSSTRNIPETKHPTDAASILQNFAMVCARKYINEKNQIRTILESAALFGIKKDNSNDYVGPWSLCMIEASKNLSYSNDGNISDINIHSYDYIAQEMATGERKILNGKIDEGYKYPGINYTVSINYNSNGLPNRVKCTIDFTPSKDKLIKKTK